jgi:hypothetical protein
MKTVIAATLAAAASVSAHSWVECVHHENAEILQWMKGNATQNVIVDPAMPWYSNFCKGWPRNKQNPGNWIDESSNYVWNIAAESWDGGDYHPPNRNACNPNQRSPGQAPNAPMAEVAAGGMFRLRFGGNGHTRGAPMGDIGRVSVYWKGKPLDQINTIDEFTPENRLAEAGFADNSFSYPDGATGGADGLVDKGNWMEVTVPAGTPSGEYPMVWVWSYNNAPQWSTCFDVKVTGGQALVAEAAPALSSPSPPAPKPTPVEAPAAVDTPDNVDAPANPPVNPPATTPAPDTNQVPPAVVVETTWTTVTEYNYYKNKRMHARSF